MRIAGSGFHSLRGLNLFDFNFQEQLAMPARSPVLLASFLFENENFILFTVLHDPADYLGAGHQGFSNQTVFAQLKEEYLIGNKLVPFGKRHLFQANFASFLYPVLLPAVFNNCVQSRILLKSLISYNKKFYWST